jgi:hypothetical protein
VERSNTIGNSDFAVCHRQKKTFDKGFAECNNRKQHTASTVSANSYLLSVFYRTLGKKKWFAECNSQKHSEKKKIFFFSQHILIDADMPNTLSLESGNGIITEYSTT